MASYRISEAARADLDRIYRRGVREHGEAQADRYFDAFFRRFEELAARPCKSASNDFRSSAGLFQGRPETDLAGPHDSQVARQLIDDVRAPQKSFKYLHDVGGHRVVRQSQDDYARVISRWIPADVREVEISGNDRGLNLPCPLGNQLIRSIFQPDVVYMGGLMAGTSEGSDGRTRKISVDQKTHAELARREGMKRFLFYQVARELQGCPDIRRREVVLALDFLESHAAGKASDYERDGHAGTTDDGFSVDDSWIDDYAVGHADGAWLKRISESMT